MTKKLNAYEYKDQDTFVSDFNLVVNNCRKYNLPKTAYYRCADVVEKVFRKLKSKHLDV